MRFLRRLLPRRDDDEQRGAAQPAADPPAFAISSEAVYRPEIDGLRAIAVVLILLFHLEVKRYTGGFIGVDCFFVISGYLITGNVRRRLSQGTFTFRDFYARRIRRLYPALATMLFLALAFGWVVLSPQHFEDLGRTTLAGAFFLSNFVFAADVGYFDLGAEFKPLLHTWSLGVEEQFYLVWPAFLVLLSRPERFRHAFVVGVSTIGVVSWVAADRVLQLDPAAVFYLMPFRLVEFAIGALCVDLERMKLRPWIGVIVTSIGLGLIVHAAITFRVDTVFPGSNAVIPCVGTGLVIWAARGGVASAVLGWHPIRWVGRVSYSLYLVHWPIIIFYKYVHPGALEARERAMLAAISLATAAVLYYGIENPFRFGLRLGVRRVDLRVLAVSGIAAICLGTVSAGVWWGQGFPHRVDDSMQQAAASLGDYQALHFFFTDRQRDRPFPMPNRRNAALIGDSHASDLLSALILGGSKLTWRHLPMQHECQLILDEREWGEGTIIPSRAMAEACDRSTTYLMNSPELQAADLIVIATTWDERGLAGFPAFLSMLQERYSGEIVLMGPRFFLGDPSQIMATSRDREEANRRFDAEKDVAKNRKTFRRLADIARKAGIEMIDVRPVVCTPISRAGNAGTKEGDGDFFCPLFDRNGTLLYWDWHHWAFPSLGEIGRRLATRPEAHRLF